MKINRQWFFSISAAAVLFFTPAWRAAAHDSPEHVIEDLTKLIKQRGATASLLTQRATEYRAMRNYTASAKDLEAALKLAPGSPEIALELARVYQAAGDSRKALDQVNLCIEKFSGGAEHYMARAEILASLNRFEQALADCTTAFRSSNPQLEWYLTRSQIQETCGRHAQRIAGLKEGIESTGSGLLEIELINAMLDAGHFKEALKKIEPELAESRWKSSWLIRRARAWQGLKEKDKAAADLKHAITEITQRIQGMKPDPSLIADRALAYALSGESSAARKDLELARRNGLDEITAGRVNRFLSKK